MRLLTVGIIASLFLIAGGTGLRLRQTKPVMPEIAGMSGGTDVPVPTTVPAPVVSAPLTLDQLFEATAAAVPPAAGTIVVRATGDVMPARSVNTQTVKRGDYTWAFSPTAAFLSAADITVINLETPLTEPCPLTNEGMIFCGNVRHTEGLRLAGVDVVNLANNHAENQGKSGIDQTVRALKEQHMGVSGMGDPVIVTVNNIRFGFLGYNDIVAQEQYIVSYAEDRMRADIASLKSRADVIIVSYHWGVEYTRQPSRRQREIAHATIDAGADLIIGNHPHWYQPVEVYKDKLIMYSHGNFIFDQMWSEETRVGLVGSYVFSGKNLVKATFTPIRIIDYGQATFTQEPETTAVLETLRRESYRLREAR